MNAIHNLQMSENRERLGRFGKEAAEIAAGSAIVAVGPEVVDQVLKNMDIEFPVGELPVGQGLVEAAREVAPTIALVFLMYAGLRLMARGLDASGKHRSS
jgi:hypothetical protein